ncbi:hypothetical protein WMF37_33105 [Sorangium sp. So ce291]|uniref:hypothetical protein n=1 Tax=Sorangium sp. So ce291 TaxID=3133294 RepID=UPI003F5F43BD
MDLLAGERRLVVGERGADEIRRVALGGELDAARPDDAPGELAGKIQGVLAERLGLSEELGLPGGAERVLCFSGGGARRALRVARSALL